MGASATEEIATGGCQCGAVRFALAGPRSGWACTLCHCRMCQKASGGPFMVFVGAAADTVTWTRGAPLRFQSSSAVRRGFCGTCGTPLTYERNAARISLAHGAFDDPRVIDPTAQLVGGSLLGWSTHVADLPREPLDGWLASQPAAIVSRQHPDCDS